MTDPKWLKLEFKIRGDKDSIDEIVDTVIHKYTEQKIDLLHFSVEGGGYHGK